MQNSACKREHVALASHQAQRGEDVPSPPVSCYSKYTVLIFKGVWHSPSHSSPPRCHSLPHLSSSHSSETLPNLHSQWYNPWSSSSAERDAASLVGFPSVVAVLPPVVLVASHPSWSPGTLRICLISGCLGQAWSPYQEEQHFKLLLRDS